MLLFENLDILQDETETTKKQRHRTTNNKITVSFLQKQVHSNAIPKIGTG